MFSTNLRERSAEKITISKISAATLQSIIDYSYTGHLTVTSENAQDLLDGAAMLQYPDVVDACCDFLKGQLDPTNCLGIARFAQVHHCNELHESALQFALNNFAQVVEEDEWLDHPLDDVIALLDCEELDVRGEEVVYEAALRWANHCRDTRLCHIPLLLRHIRLTALGPEYIHKILSNDLAKVDLKDTKLIREAIESSRGEPRPSTVAREVLVVLGGLGPSCNVRQVEAFDPQRNRWLSLPSLPDNRSFFSVASLNNDIYITGGIVEGKVVPSVYQFHTEKQCWVSAPPMHTARARHASVAWQGRLFVLGGINEKCHGGIVPVDVIESYTPECGWMTSGTSPFPRTQSRAVPHGEELLEIGGTQGQIKPRAIESYLCDARGHVATGEQFVLPDCIQYAQMAVSNGVFYILWEDARRLIALDPKKRTWRGLASMKFQHVHSGAAELGGKFYVVGGLVDQLPSDRVEIYDPETDTWCGGPPLSTARACHGAVVIKIT